MKNIKDLKIKTLEGFEIKNLQKFPSEEWGEEGGTSAQIYYKGKLAIELFDAGNGGMTDADILLPLAERDELIHDGLAFLKRTDPSYQGNDIFADKTEQTFDDDDWVSVTNSMLCRYEAIEAAKKYFKNPRYKAVAIVACKKGMYEEYDRYLPMRLAALDDSIVRQWMSEHFPDETVQLIWFVTPDDLITF